MSGFQVTDSRIAATADQINIDPAADAYDRRLGHMVGYDLRMLPAVIPSVDAQEYRENHAGEKTCRGKQVLCRPKEVDTSQESDEQRRIAERRQRAADVGDQEYCEHQHMRIVTATLVRPYQGSHDDHGGAGGAYEARQYGAQQEHSGIAGGSSVQIAGH
jgi:hypothetical protein